MSITTTQHKNEWTEKYPSQSQRETTRARSHRADSFQSVLRRVAECLQRLRLPDRLPNPRHLAPATVSAWFLLDSRYPPAADLAQQAMRKTESQTRLVVGSDTPQPFPPPLAVPLRSTPT